MHSRKTRTEVTIETETLIRVRRAPGSVRDECPHCRAERLMISPAAAATLAGVSTRAIYRGIESGRLHFSERPGELLICSESLLHLSEDLR